MSVRIGKIDLVGLSRIITEDTRSLVKQRGPGQAGGLFQDLGREPVTIAMEGILLGDDTQNALEELRQAHAKAKPMSFAADAIAGADLTHVLIADLQVRQLAGHASRFAFFLRVREHTEPPEAPGAGAAKVDKAAKAEAEEWQRGAVDAASVKQDPTSLMSELDKNPGLVAHLDGNELGELAATNLDTMNGADCGKLLGAVGEMNPSAVTGMVDNLKKKSKWGQFIEKLSAAGAKVLEFAKRIKLETILSLYKMIAGGTEFLAKLKAVWEKARGVWGKAETLDIEAEFEKLKNAWEGAKPDPNGPSVDVTFADAYKIPDAQGQMRWAWELDPQTIEAHSSQIAPARNDNPGNNYMADVIKAVAELIAAIDDLLQTDTFQNLANVVKDLQLGKIVNPLFEGMCKVLGKLVVWVEKLRQLAALPRITAPLFLHFEELAILTNMSIPGRKEDLQEVGWGEFIALAQMTHDAMTLFSRIGHASQALTGKDLLEKSLQDLGKNLEKLHKTFDDDRKKLASLPADSTSSTSAGELAT